MELTEARKKIDEIDRALISLFRERMDVAAEIARYKKENGLPVLDRTREEQKLDDISAQLPESLAGYGRELYETIFSLSRAYQESVLKES